MKPGELEGFTKLLSLDEAADRPTLEPILSCYRIALRFLFCSKLADLFPEHKFRFYSRGQDSYLVNFTIDLIVQNACYK